MYLAPAYRRQVVCVVFKLRHARRNIRRQRDVWLLLYFIPIYFSDVAYVVVKLGYFDWNLRLKGVWRQV